VPISVQIIKENKDGSADALIHFDKEGLETLVRHGLISLITQGLNDYRIGSEEIVPFPLSEDQKATIRKARKLIAEDEQ